MATSFADLLALFQQNASRSQQFSFPELRQFEPGRQAPVLPSAMQSGGSIAQAIMNRSIAPRFFEDEEKGGPDEEGKSQSGPGGFPDRDVSVSTRDVANFGIGLGASAIPGLGQLNVLNNLAKTLGLPNIDIAEQLGFPDRELFGLTMGLTDLDTVGFPDDPELANMTFTEAWEATFGGGDGTPGDNEPSFGEMSDLDDAEDVAGGDENDTADAAEEAESEDTSDEDDAGF